jgi:hypothetical protein
MGAGRLVTLFSWVLALLKPTVTGGLLGWRSKHRTEAGPQVLGAWSLSLDGDLDPLIGVERVVLASARDTSQACVFRVPGWDILIRESPFLRDGMTWLWSSTVVRTETWKMIKMVLIAQPLLESSIIAYIEWLVNGLVMTANKIEYKDTYLVNPQARKSRISLVFSFLLTVSLAEYNWVLRVCSTLLQVTGTGGTDTCVWKRPDGFSEDFFYVADLELFKVSTKIIYKGKLIRCHYFMYINCSSW